MDADQDIRIAFVPRYVSARTTRSTPPIANRRMGHRLPESWQDRLRRPLGVSGVVGAYMAGMRCPTAERLTDLVHDISDIEDREKHAVRELFAQLPPAECDEFMVTTDASPREVARLMRECGVTRGLVVNWISRFSSDPGWHEDKALPIWWGIRGSTTAGRFGPVMANAPLRARRSCDICFEPRLQSSCARGKSSRARARPPTSSAKAAL